MSLHIFAMAILTEVATCLRPVVAATCASRVTSKQSAFLKPIRGTSSAQVIGQNFRVAAAPSFSVGRSRKFAVSAMASVDLVGKKLPDGEFAYFDSDGNMQSISVEQLTKGKKLVLFAVPGAFTPTCSQKHLPGFIENADALKAKGIDTIACVSVNDPFVMKAWADQTGTGDKILMLADGSGVFTKSLGVELDLSDKGLGIRSRRYSLLAEDGVIKTANVEEGGAFTVSGADEILKAL